MHGVSKITFSESIMLISIQDADATTMVSVLKDLADAGVVVDMISQTAPLGSRIRFSFTASFSYFDQALKAIGTDNNEVSPMISGGYCKVYLYGKEMVDSVGVAARALDALVKQGVDIALITTSDLDISILVRQEDEDMAVSVLEKAFEL